MSREDVLREAELAARDANVVELSEHARYAATDLGNAGLFAAMHSQRLRYVPAQRRWLVWKGGRWRQDRTGEAERAAKETARELLVRASKLDNSDERGTAAKWAFLSQGEARIGAMLKLAGTEPDIALAADDLDRESWLLSCGNGTLDLHTGKMREHDPGDLISLGTDVRYDPDAICKRWLRFLREVFDGDQDLIGFIRRAVGYSLTGEIGEHALFVLHGTGANGKSTFIETISRLAGDLAKVSPFDTFARTRNGGPRNDIARLHRARLVVAAESGEGRRLDEATVKLLTGGDTVAARFLYDEHFEFRPEFKLWLVTNHRPRVSGDDDAIWRRVRLVPFDVSFLGREDHELAATLETELPGILNWAVQGCLEWAEHGLGLPDAVKNATAEYREDEDVLSAFIDECCILNGEVDAPDLRTAFDQFCASIGERPLTASALGQRLGRRGIHAKRGAKGKRSYEGISIKGDG